MLTYVARRVLLAIPTLLGVATIVFMLVRLLPGDPASVIAGPQATEADIARIRHQLDLDQPIWLQYVSFLTRLLQGNLGISTRSGHTVVQEIFSRAPYTLELAIIASVIATLLGIGPACWARCGRTPSSTSRSRAPPCSGSRCRSTGSASC